MTTISLSNGVALRVEVVPPLAMAEIERRYTTPLGLEGEAARAAEVARQCMVREASWLFALPDVVVPEDWQFPRGLTHAGIQPREGDLGKILDYIEYGLLSTIDDLNLVQSIMYNTTLTEEEIGAAESYFQPDGGREAAPGNPG